MASLVLTYAKTGRYDRVASELTSPVYMDSEGMFPDFLQKSILES